MPHQFTEAVSTALENAFQEAQRKNNTEVTENHLLWAFLKNPEDYFHTTLTSLNTNPDQLLHESEELISRAPTYSGTSGNPPNMSWSLKVESPKLKRLPNNGKILTLVVITSF